MSDGAITRRPLWLKAVFALIGLLIALLLLAVFFPWDTLREPLNRYVSEKIGRRFEISRHLDVNLGWRTATVFLDGIKFANPEWARDPELVTAEKAEIEIRLWPLLAGKINLPRVTLSGPTVGLQMETDGRRTWALGKDTSDKGTVPTIGLVQVDNGQIDFLAKHLGVDMHADVDFDTQRGELPLSFKIKGRYKGQPLTASGRTGNALQLNSDGQPPFPIEFAAAAGQTQLKVAGTVAELAGPDGLDAKFEIKGQTLGALFPLLGIALPQTSPYALSGELRKNGTLWSVAAMKGKLGLSDINGDMRYDQASSPPKLAGDLRSKVMDMDDLGPLLGLPPTERSAKAVEGVAPPPTLAKTKRAGNVKVLPTAPLDFERLRAMNADVKYTAESIRNVRDVPLDRGSVHVKLDAGVLALEPLDLGVGGGSLAGAVRIDSTQNPADIRASLQLKGMQLNKLIPKIETMRSSFSKIEGRVNLSGRGNSVAEWLGNSSGDVAAITGRGRFSNLLLEYAGLDGGEVIKFLLTGDNNVVLRCAAFAFDVRKGVMQGLTLMFDTDDTLFNMAGSANLSTETLDFVVTPQPKDLSILSLRTPLLIGGHFGKPTAGVKAVPLAERGLLALALGAINPLLALAATIETGPGEDADCQATLAEAAKPSAGAAAAGAAKAKGIKN